jgi:hypothetical protein
VDPSPQAADLLTRFAPFDRSSLEQAIDRFLGRFDGIGVELSWVRELWNWVPASLALAAVVLASNLIVLWRSSREGRSEAIEADHVAGLVRFPVPPGPWSRDEP